MVKYFSGLRFRLMAVIIVAFIPAFALIFYTAHGRRSEAVENVHREGVQNTKFAAGLIGHQVEGARQLLIAVGYEVEEHSHDTKHLNRRLKKLADSFPQYLNIIVADTNGDLKYAGIFPEKGAKPVNYADRLWFKRATQSKSFSEGEFITSRTVFKKIITFAHPVLNKAGEVRFVIAAAFDVEWLEREIGKILLPENSEIMVIDSAGAVIGCRDQGKTESMPFTEREIIKTILSQKEGTIEAVCGDGVKRIYSFTTVPGTSGNIFVATGLPRDVVLANINRTMMHNLLWLSIIALLVLGLARGGMGAAILKPMDALLKTANRLARGDLSARTGSKKGYGEINELSHDFDVMADALQHREEALRVSEKRHSDIVGLANDWIWELDKNGVYTFVSPRSQAVLGYSPDEMIGRTPFDFMSPEKAKKVSDIFFLIVAKRDLFTFKEDRYIHKDGHMVILETSGMPIFDGTGNFIGYRGVERDITERKRLHEELIKASKLESVGILAGGIAHDFNNLLTAIIGYVEVAKMKIKPDDAAFITLEKAITVCEKAKELTGRLLTFSKGGEPFKRKIDISELTRMTAHSVLTGSNVKCDFFIPDDLRPVETDERQIKQVIRNIIINAQEAMPDGGVIKITGENVVVAEKDKLPLKSGVYVKISIEDNGTGIPPKNLPYIFDPYFSTKDTYYEKGLGLGLAVCHSIIVKHDGYIGVESEPGKGTTLHIYLPAFD